MNSGRFWVAVHEIVEDGVDLVDFPLHLRGELRARRLAFGRMAQLVRDAVVRMRRLPASFTAAEAPSSCHETNSVSPIAVSATRKKITSIDVILTASVRLA